jgi:hypothetical protein
LNDCKAAVVATEVALMSNTAKTVYVVMMEWGRGSGDYKEFSQHESYSAADYAVRLQGTNGGRCVIVPKTVAAGTSPPAKGGFIGGLFLILVLGGLYHSCTGPAKPHVKPPQTHAAHHKALQ